MIKQPTSENKMALFNIMSTVLISGINFITIPIFTRVLDTAGFGIVNIYTAWVQICTVFVGLKADGSIGSAYANIDKEEQDSYQLSILVMSLIPFAALLVLSISFSAWLSELLDMPSVLVVAMVLQSYGAFVISLFSMRFIFRKDPAKNFAMSVGICVATTLVSLAFIAFAFQGENGYVGRVLGLSLPNLLLGMILFVSLAAKGPAVKFGYWKFCLALTLPLIFHGLSQIVLAQTGKVAIQQYLGNSAAGVYSIAVTVVSLMNAIYGALNNAFVPFMYDDLAGKTGEEVKQCHFRNYFSMFTLGTIAFLLMTPELLKLLSTEAYWGAIPLLPPLIVGQYCVFLYSFPVNFEFYSMKTSSIAVGTVGAAIANIALCLLLVPVLGMVGAALATALAYISLFAFHFLIARYLLGDRNYPARNYGLALIAVIGVAVGCYPLSGLPLVRWIVGALLLAVALGRIIRTRSIF